jgi:aspartokinase
MLNRFLSRLKNRPELNIKSHDFTIDDIQIIYPITDLVFSLRVSPNKTLTQIYGLLENETKHFLNHTVGNNEINVFVSSKHKQLILDQFKNEELIYQRDNLCSINLKFNRRFIDIPGTTYQVLRVLAWNNINLVEVVSTFSEITLFVDRRDSQLLLELLTLEFMKK